MTRSGRGAQVRSGAQVICFSAPPGDGASPIAGTRVRALAVRLADHFADAGLDLASPGDAERLSGVVSVACPRSATVAARLAARGVAVDALPGIVRLMPHAAMSEALLDRGAAEVIDVIMPAGPDAPQLTSYPPPLAGLSRLDGATPGLVRYGGEPDQFAQLWRPARPASAPVVALIHGGYWRRRYRLDVMNALARELCGLGAAVLNLEYRRLGTPGEGRVGVFDDIAMAMAMLPALARAEDLDLARLVVAGHSAGGYLALRWGRSGAQRQLAERAIWPRLVMSLAGVCDLNEAVRLGLSNGAAQRLLLATGAAAGLEPGDCLSCPPQLLMHGTADDSVPLALSRRYYRDAKASGIPCELRVIAGAGHFDLIDPLSAAGSAVVRRIARACGLTRPAPRRLTPRHSLQGKDNRHV